MKQEFVATFISNSGNKTTRRTEGIAKDKDHAKRQVESMGNKVVAVVFQKTRHDL